MKCCRCRSKKDEKKILANGNKLTLRKMTACPGSVKNKSRRAEVRAVGTNVSTDGTTMVLQEMTAGIANANNWSRGTIRHAKVALKVVRDKDAHKMMSRNMKPLPH